MAEDETSVLLLVVVVVVAVLGLGLSLASFATDQSMTGMMQNGFGGMMNRSTTTASAPGALEWAILLLSAAFLGVAALLLLRSRRTAPAPMAAPSPAIVPSPMPPAQAPPLASPASSSAAGVPEPTLVKLLDEDEKRMYLELRDHGGQMLQRDLVALGIFSKAKVTRVLDKLEAKGLVVREAHGMTNRVRLVTLPPR